MVAGDEEKKHDNVELEVKAEGRISKLLRKAKADESLCSSSSPIAFRTMVFGDIRRSSVFKLERWALQPEPSTFAPSSNLSNKDMDPVPEQLRTWTTINYIFYWISDGFNVAAWELASSMIAIGLSWYFLIFVFCLTILTSEKEASLTCYRVRSYHYLFGYDCKWNYRCPLARPLPGFEPIIVWVLVQLFQCPQPGYFVHVLVRRPELYWFRMCISGAFLFVTNYGLLSKV